MSSFVVSVLLIDITFVFFVFFFVMFKILKGKERINAAATFCQLAKNSKWSRGHDLKLFKPRCKTAAMDKHSSASELSTSGTVCLLTDVVRARLPYWYCSKNVKWI